MTIYKQYIFIYTYIFRMCSEERDEYKFMCPINALLPEKSQQEVKWPGPT